MKKVKLVILIMLITFNLILLSCGQSEPTGPAGPTTLSIVSISYSQIDIVWEDNSFNENGFTLEKGLSPDFSTATKINCRANTTRYLDTNVSELTTYYYRICAYSDEDISRYSNSIYVKTTSINEDSFMVFPADNPWNTDISGYPVHPNSDNYVNFIGRGKRLHPEFGTTYDDMPHGIPYMFIDSTTPRLQTMNFDYADECDPGPYPMPEHPFIEGGPFSEQDRHIILIDISNLKLYEYFHVMPPGIEGNPSDYLWNAGSFAEFDLSSNSLRPAGWTSADAAGLPIFPGLVRYEEAVTRGVINHALRFTSRGTSGGYIPPATHNTMGWGSIPNHLEQNPNINPPYFEDGGDLWYPPPMGLRFRLKASFDISGFAPEVRVILQTLKTYGMFLADNGGDWFITGAPDPRWNDDNLVEMQAYGDGFGVPGDAFEAIYTGDIIY